MSASITPTLRPSPARAAARFAVIEDLPTPPLPEVTAMTLVRESGREKGISRSGRPPLSFSRRALRCSSSMTPISTLTCSTPSSAPTRAVTSFEMAVRSGQPAVVRRTLTCTTAPSMRTRSGVTMLMSVMGRRISGSMTCERASMTRSIEGVMGMILRIPGAFFQGAAPAGVRGPTRRPARCGEGRKYGRPRWAGAGQP